MLETYFSYRSRSVLFPKVSRAFFSGMSINSNDNFASWIKKSKTYSPFMNFLYLFLTGAHEHTVPLVEGHVFLCL